jgi:hypothetical protein
VKARAKKAHLDLDGACFPDLDLHCVQLGDALEVDRISHRFFFLSLST